MEASQFWHPSFISSWIFVFLLSSVYSGTSTPIIHLESTVFVALSGRELNINCELRLPANQSKDTLTCSDSLNTHTIYSCDIRATADQPANFNQTLKLENLKSGEYSCQFKTAKVYWFLLVRETDFIKPEVWEDTEIIIVTTFTCVLLVFSVVGSVYVFRGNWKERITECDDTGSKQKQNRDERQERELEQDNVTVITASSTSFYASLEPRPRSIYDVLDRSAANREPDQCKAKPKKQEPQETMAHTTQSQHEDMECVYENFE